MNGLRLDLPALRANSRPEVSLPGTTPETILNSLGDRPFSRREFLALSGAALGASAATWVAKDAAIGPFELVGDSTRLAFLLGGRERWVIDTRLFAGAPKLSVIRGKRHIRLTLKDARFPGTNLPADFVADLRSQIIGWLMNLRLRAGDFQSRVPFERWLLGDDPARSPIRLAGEICRLSQASSVLSASPVCAEFFPNWVLRFEGPGAAGLSGLGSTAIHSDSAAMALLAPNEPSIVLGPEQRRTLFTLDRGAKLWEMEPATRALTGMRIEADGSAFDRITIESGEARRALLAQATGDGSRLTFTPGPHLLASDGETLRVPLRKARFAALWDSEGEQTALVAQLPEEPLWLHADGCALELGDRPGDPPFELVQVNGEVRSLRCTPALNRSIVPMSGAIAAATRPPGDSRVALVSNSVETPVEPEMSYVSLEPQPQGGGIRLIAAPCTVVRIQDLLCLGFEFTNLTLVPTGGTAQLVRKDANAPAYIGVVLGPQNISEQAFFEAADQGFSPPGPSDSLPQPPAVKAQISGDSRLVFSLPSGMNQVPYTLEALLNWSQFEPVVAPVAQPLPGNLHSPQPVIAQPDNLTTSIEAPYRLMLSPSSLGRWAHSAVPVEHAGLTELWHTRLGVLSGSGVDERGAYQRIVRAIWSPDYNPLNPPQHTSQPPYTSLDPLDRHEIVRLTSDFTIRQYSPQPVQINRLMLTAMGAWLDSRGAWPLAPQGPQGFDVREWVHRATMGRDHYVRVVYQGYLLPFGHGASLVKVTERKFEPGPSGNMAAYLRQRLYLVVRQPEKSFPAPGQPYNGRESPFQVVHITTQTTPNLDPPDNQTGGFGLGQSAFWPTVGGQLFQFAVIGIDMEGREVDFTLPMVFVDENLAFDFNNSIQSAYMNGLMPDNSPRRQAPLAGKRVAYTPVGKGGDASLPTKFMSFSLSPSGLSHSELQQADQVAYYPVMSQAQVDIPAVSQLVATGPDGVAIQWYENYIRFGIPDPSGPVADHPNAGEVFARLVQPVTMSFTQSGTADKAGGLITPDMHLVGLSRALGTVGGDATSVDDIAKGNFNPQKVFGSLATANLLGVIPLGDLVGQLQGLDFNADSKALKIKSRTIYGQSNPNGQPDPLAAPTAIETTVDWDPPSIQAVPPVFENSYSDPATQRQFPSSLSIHALIHTDLCPSPSSSPQPQPCQPQTNSRVTGTLQNFTLDFAECIFIGFTQLTFTTTTGQKMSVQPQIGSVSFGSVMQFVEALEAALQSAGANLGGASIDLQPSGVDVKYALALPDIASGAMTLQNLSLSADLSLPFTGDPAIITFAFCSMARPFTLSYCGFAGGGFCVIAVSLQGVQALEVSLWFGGTLALDLYVVASAGVTIMAGIDLKWDGNTVSPSAFWRETVIACILGLVTVTLDVTLVIQYEPADNVFIGQATLSVDVDIVGFSKSVDLTFEAKIHPHLGVSLGMEAIDVSRVALGGGPELAVQKTRPIQPGPGGKVGPPIPPQRPVTLTNLMSQADWRLYRQAFAA